MNVRAIVSLVGIGALTVSFGVALAQEGKPPKKPQGVKAEAPPEMAAPKPGPHHAHLAKSAGTWDATVESFMAPDQAPQVSKGVEVNTLDSGGLWLVSDFKGTFMGQPFQGHGLMGYDTTKSRYTGVWADSMSTAMMASEGTCDGSGGRLTMTSQGPGMDGKMTTWTMVSEFKDADTRVFSMSFPGPDGKDQLAMRITFKRRK
jgi:uncharacterized protein DUF1579